MVIIDAGNLYFRMLYIAVKQSNPSKDKDGMFITSEFERQFIHLTLSSLMNTRMMFMQQFGDVALTTEGKDLWRKKYYKVYKAQRKVLRDSSEINFVEFFKVVDKLTKFIDDYTPIKVVSEPSAEGDDIVAALILIDSVDHDFIQLLSYPNVTLRNPIKKTITKAPPSIRNFKLEHVLCGDKGDNVPNILYGSEYTDTFIEHLKTLNFTNFDPYTLETNDMNKMQEIYDNFDVFKTNRKGEELFEKDIYKMMPFGPKTAEKYIKELDTHLKKDWFKRNFIRNSTLVLFDKIPEEVHNNIIKSFINAKHDTQINEIMNFANKNSLLELVASTSDFLIKPKKELTFEYLLENRNKINEWC